MKKLMIVAAVAMAAMVGSAATASWNWKTTGSQTKGYIYDVTGEKAGNLAAYIFDAATVDQDTLLKSLRKGDAITKYTAADTTTLASSKIAEKGFSWGTASTDDETYYNSFYAVVVDGKNVLFSTFLENKPAGKSSATDLAFANPGGSDGWSKVINGTADYKGAGWYSTAAVPEPTSAMLLLLGVAGLALRRRRA